MLKKKPLMLCNLLTTPVAKCVRDLIIDFAEY